MPTLNSIKAVPSLPEIGRIRLGRKETKTRKDKSTYEVPVNLDHFIVTFNSGFEEAEKEYHKIFGEEEVKEFPVVLPFGTMEQNYDDWFTAYRSGKLIARIGVNDKIDPFSYHWETHFVTAGQAQVRPVVRNWLSVETKKPVPVDMMENIDENSGFGIGPIIYSTGKGDKQKDYYASYAMKLHVMIIPLAMAGYVGYFTMYSTSVRNGREIAGFLKEATEKADLFGKHSLVGVPMRLFRTIEKSGIPGSTATKDENFVKMGFAANYQIAAMETARKLANPSMQQLPAGDEVEIEAEFIDLEELEEEEIPWEQEAPSDVVEEEPAEVEEEVKKPAAEKKTPKKPTPKPDVGEVAQVKFPDKLIKTLIKRKVIADEKALDESLYHSSELPSTVDAVVAEKWINNFYNAMSNGADNYSKAAELADKYFLSMMAGGEDG